MNQVKPLRIAISAAEHSGDLLAADLMHSLQAIHPHISFEGVAGANMRALGCNAIFNTEQLSVMGLVEVIKHLPRILTIKRKLVNYWLKNPPDIFIGVDSPDFNLRVAKKLHQAGVKTVQYVSPQVWAWRQGRAKKISQYLDLMLVLLPFEKNIYQQYNLTTRFVGHPMADQIPLVPDKLAAKKALGFAEDDKVVTILPGSRKTEIEYLSQTFIETAIRCQQHDQQLHFLVAAANDKCKHIFEGVYQTYQDKIKLTILSNQTRQALYAADVVLLASGTATLETMLTKTPMVIAYKMTALTHYIARKLVKVNYIGLPNLLANKELVPEFIQHQATAENLAQALLAWLQDTAKCQQLVNDFTELHKQLLQNASQQAAQAILDIV